MQVSTQVVVFLLPCKIYAAASPHVFHKSNAALRG